MNNTARRHPMSASRGVLHGLVLSALLGASCSPSTNPRDESGNPFLDEAGAGKGDTGYMNPDGIEVEVDVEADAEAPGQEYILPHAPPLLAQFALTYLRKHGTFYLESLADDSTSNTRVEWLIDGAWVTAKDAEARGTSKLKHFRIRGMNAVLLHGASEGVKQGDVFTATVPRNPYTVMSTAGDRCADPNSHMDLSRSVYWYLWNPGRMGCAGTVATQEMTVTVSKMTASSKVTYPEYDQLVADGMVTAVVLFGQLGDGKITDSDPGMVGFERMSGWLTEGGFTGVTAPLGRRFTKHLGEVDFQIDLYSPHEFSGLNDSAHFKNFQKALSEHEIVIYYGHSMLGASDFWSQPRYPGFYQVFLYGGCLGYEYYIRPIVEGKGGWANLDLMSSVVEVDAPATDIAGPFLARIAWALDHDYGASWRDILVAVRKAVGNSQFGVSGVRDNCYSPLGSLCSGQPPPAGVEKRFESSTAVAIPDNDGKGVTSVIEVEDDFVASRAVVELAIQHTYVSDLHVWLEHDGFVVDLFKYDGGEPDGLRARLVVDELVGKRIKGTWTLHVADSSSSDTGTLEHWALLLTP